MQISLLSKDLMYYYMMDVEGSVPFNLSSYETGEMNLSTFNWLMVRFPLDFGIATLP